MNRYSGMLSNRNDEQDNGCMDESRIFEDCGSCVSPDEDYLVTISRIRYQDITVQDKQPGS